MTSSYPGIVTQFYCVKAANGQKHSFGTKLHRRYAVIFYGTGKDHRAVSVPDFVSTVIATRRQKVAFIRPSQT